MFHYLSILRVFETFWWWNLHFFQKDFHERIGAFFYNRFFIHFFLSNLFPVAMYHPARVQCVSGTKWSLISLAVVCGNVWRMIKHCVWQTYFFFYSVRIWAFKEYFRFPSARFTTQWMLVPCLVCLVSVTKTTCLESRNYSFYESIQAPTRNIVTKENKTLEIS